IGVVVVVVGVERVAVDGILVIFDGFVEIALCIVGGGKLVEALWIVLELFEQRLAGRDGVVVAFHRVVGIGETGIGCREIVGIQLAAPLDDVLVGAHGLFKVVGFQVSFREVEARSEAIGIELD